jgi:hypothetical protein
MQGEVFNAEKDATDEVLRAAAFPSTTPDNWLPTPAQADDLRTHIGLIWSDRVNLRNLWVCFGCFRRFSRTERAAVGAVFSDD